MSEWSHLPNARHIDWIIRDVKLNLSDWDAARDAAWDAVRFAAQNAAKNAVKNAAQDAAWWAAQIAAQNAAWGAAQNAILALIAYDHAGALVDRPVDQVRVMAILGQPAAILLLLACRIKEKRRELIALS